MILGVIVAVIGTLFMLGISSSITKDNVNKALQKQAKRWGI